MVSHGEPGTPSDRISSESIDLSRQRTPQVKMYPSFPQSCIHSIVKRLNITQEMPSMLCWDVAGFFQSSAAFSGDFLSSRRIISWAILPMSCSFCICICSKFWFYKFVPNFVTWNVQISYWRIFVGSAEEHLSELRLRRSLWRRRSGVSTHVDAKRTAPPLPTPLNWQTTRESLRFVSIWGWVWL